jgi:hypothetical protein
MSFDLKENLQPPFHRESFPKNGKSAASAAE